MSKKEKVEEYLGDVLELLGSLEDADIAGVNSVALIVVLDECSKVVSNAANFVDDLPSACEDSVREIYRLIGEIEKVSKDIVDFLSKIPYGQSIIVYLLANKEKQDVIQRLLGRNGLKGLLRRFLNALEDIEGILDEIEDEERENEFSGRSGTKRHQMIISYINKVSELSLSLSECYNNLTYLYNDIRRVLHNRIDSDRIRKLASMEDLQGKYQVARQLSLRSSRLYANTMLDILTGLSSITARPAYEQIELRLRSLHSDKEPPYLSMDELFFRYPPFEPISAKFSINMEGSRVKVAGSYVWFIDFKELRHNSRERLRFGDGLVYKGFTVERAGKVFLSSVEPINVLTSGSGEVRITLYSQLQRKEVFLKYGSKKLRDTIVQCLKEGYKGSKIEECVREKYLEFLGVGKRHKSKGSSYDPFDLSYVWYCGLGRGLSTDPWDVRCPFERQCDYAAGFKAGERCPYWGWSRRIFPKVFPQIDVEVHVERTEDEGSVGFFKVFSARHVYIVENYTGVQLRMPARVGEGIPLTLTFRRPLIRELPDTNVIGAVFPLDFILKFGSVLLEGGIDALYVELGNGRRASFVDLLVTKFFLWKETRRGVLSYDYFKNNSTNILAKYRGFREKLKREKKMKREFGQFVAMVLAHTLAHLLVSYLASKLELELDDFIYYYKINEESNAVEIYAAENSPFGNLDLPGQVREQFGSVSDMFSKFIQDVISMLRAHDKETEETLTVRERLRKEFFDRNNTVGSLLNRMGELYGRFISEGFVLDQWYFGLHLLLSNEYRDFAQKAGLNPRDALQYFDDLISLAGPPLCLDGCNNCVMFEKRCRETLGQSLSVSRRLVEFFLGFIYGRRELRAIGGSFGPWFLQSVAEKRLVAISPFVNKAGVEFLESLASRGVDVVLVTRKDMLERIPSDTGFRVAVQRSPSHEKVYIVDRRLVVLSSWNLTIGSKSWETFLILWDRGRAEELEKKYLRGVKWIR